MFEVNRKAMIRNYYNHIPHPTLNTKRKRRTHTKFDQCPRKTRTINQMNSSFPNRWSFSYPNWKRQRHLFYLFSILNYKTDKNKTGTIMGNWYSAYHIAKDHIHTDRTCNTEEHQQKYMYRLGTVSNRLLGVGGGAETRFTGSKHSLSAPAVIQPVWTACRCPNPSMNQHRVQTNHEYGL